MTPLTDAEAVKLLREALNNTRTYLSGGDGTLDATIDAVSEALAATAPPKPYRLVGNTLTHNIECGSACVLRFEPDATYDERAAVLDALNRLHEQEASK